MRHLQAPDPCLQTAQCPQMIANHESESPVERGLTHLSRARRAWEAGAAARTCAHAHAPAAACTAALAGATAAQPSQKPDRLWVHRVWCCMSVMAAVHGDVKSRWHARRLGGACACRKGGGVPPHARRGHAAAGTPQPGCPGRLPWRGRSPAVPLLVGAQNGRKGCVAAAGQAEAELEAASRCLLSNWISTIGLQFCGVMVWNRSCCCLSVGSACSISRGSADRMRTREGQLISC